MTGAVSGIIQKSGLNQSEVDARVALYQPESGTFTPFICDSSLSDSEGQTYSEQAGRWRKTGDIMDVWFVVTITNLGTLDTGSAVYIGGLPESAANLGLLAPANIGIAQSLAITAGQNLGGAVIDNTAFIQIYLWDATSGNTGALVSEISTGARVSGHARYIVA